MDFWSLFRLIGASLCLCLFAGITQSQKIDPTHRIALVVGISDYDEIGDLENPKNDAAELANALYTSGFEVIERLDPDAATLRASIRTMASSIKDGAQVVFYFAGHAIQHEGENYLLANDVSLAKDTMSDILRRAVPASEIADLLSQSQAGLSVLILDACRDNPLMGLQNGNLDNSKSVLQGYSGSAGLAPLQATGPNEILISFATAYNQVALDGPEGGNSPFTEALLRHITTPDMEIGQLFKRVRGDVRRATEGKQIPWITATLENDHVLHGAADLAGESADTLGLLPPIQAVQRAFWISAKSMGRVEDLEAYEKAFPNGKYSEEASKYLEIAKLSPSGRVEIELTPSDVDGDLAVGRIVPQGGGRGHLSIASGTSGLFNSLSEEFPESTIEIQAIPRNLILRLEGNDADADTQLFSGLTLSADEVAQITYEAKHDAIGPFGPLIFEVDGSQREVSVFGVVDACDQVAGYPEDNYRVGSGVRWELMRVDIAISACSIAVQRYPDNMRFQALLSRAYRRAEKGDLATKWNRAPAEANYPAAVGAEGRMHRLGIGREIDPQKALDYFMQAGALGDAGSISKVGEMHLRGEAGLPRDEQKALEYFRRAAAKGNDWSFVQIARIYLHRLRNSDENAANNFSEAVRWLKLAVESGSPQGKLELGKLYEAGFEGVASPDPEGALKLYESSAGQGYGFAMARLGRKLIDDKLGHGEIDEGLDWISKAAELRVPEGQYWMGRALLDGDGIEQDRQKGLDLLLNAAESNHANSLFYLGEFYERGNLIEQDLSKARESYLKALTNGHLGAAQRLAQMFKRGLGGNITPLGMVRILETAAKLGDINSTRELAELLSSDESGVLKDEARARSLFEEAIEAGDNWALHKLALALEKGLGGNDDPLEAVKFMKEAAKAGIPWAYIDLARYYETGYGLEMDPKAALVWLARASNSGQPGSSARRWAAEKISKFETESLIGAIGQLLVSHGKIEKATPGVLYEQLSERLDDRDALEAYLVDLAKN